MTLHVGEVVVDVDVIRRLLRAQRPELAELEIAHVGGGTDNTMYRIGATYLARFPRTRGKVAALEKELAWLPRLRPLLSQPIPTPVHAGRPDVGYPLPWALYEWIDGEDVSPATVTDWARYGRDLADFVRSLHDADLMEARRTGALCWYRGASLHPRGEWGGPCFSEAQSQVSDLDVTRLEALWRQALQLPAPTAPHVWLHADLKPTNVLARHGALAAVIDFGALSVGYPDAEHAVVWDLPEAARTAYRATLAIDDLTWMRARAWALALGVNGVAEYWTRFPAIGLEGLHRLHAILGEPC